MNKTIQIASQVYLPVTICPFCAGAGTIESAPPVVLTNLQFQIWDAIRRSRDGLSAAALAARVYADRHNGAPRSAAVVMRMTIKSANHRLAAVGLRIASTTGGRRNTYKIQHIDGAVS